MVHGVPRCLPFPDLPPAAERRQQQHVCHDHAVIERDDWRETRRRPAKPPLPTTENLLEDTAGLLRPLASILRAHEATHQWPAALAFC